MMKKILIPLSVVILMALFLFFYPMPETELKTIYLDLRLPRIILGVAVGGGLALSGVILQTLFRNPLVEPLTLGINGASTFGSILSMLLGIKLSIFGLPFYTGISMLFIFLVMIIQKILAKTKEDLLIVGIVLNIIFSSLTYLLVYHSYIIFGVEASRWLYGSLSFVGWQLPLFFLGVVLSIFLFFWRKAQKLNILTEKPEYAFSLGVNPEREFYIYFSFVSVIVALSTIFTGPIGFLGLIAPHLARRLFGFSHEVVLPSSFLMGVILLLFADGFSRIVFYPKELPIGIVLSLIGGPYFIYLVVKRQSS